MFRVSGPVTLVIASSTFPRRFCDTRLFQSHPVWAPRRDQRMKRRNSKCFHLALVLLLNFGGGPVSWMHLGPGQKSMTIAQASGLERCAQHRTQTAPRGATTSGDNHKLPCCADGSCQCGCPPSFPLVVMTTAVAVELSAAFAATALTQPSLEPQSSLLRPPIA